MFQPIAPIMLIYFSWKEVLVCIIALNILWALFVRYRYVSVGAAFLGPLFVRIKWIVCPASALYLYSRGEKGVAVVALLWPVIAMFIGWLPTQVGKIQGEFMAKLGYTPTSR